MSDMSQWLLLIPGLPLLAAAIILFFGEAFLKRFSNLPCILAIAGSCLLSFFVLGFVRRAAVTEPHLESALESIRAVKSDRYDDARLAQLEAAQGEAAEALASLHYDDMAVEADVLTNVPDPEERRAAFERLLGRATKRHLVDAKHPDRVLYARYTWIAASEDPDVSKARVSFGLRADALSAIMLVMITSIATLIAVYSTGYMHGDPGYPRFFAAVALFVFSMCMLVMADNFLLLFLGWEGVGLCSYLLIGFWYEKPSAADAARKAFLVTRIGDVGLFLGILMLWLHYGSLDYDAVFGGIVKEVNDGRADHTFLLAAALLLFCGAVGKSAQFPLHVWLPDAMEGPTPVSALIHAATMVTAGVYLVARCTPLFMAVPEAQLVVACAGGITMLLAALIALTQNDLKRVLAYSTLSQLGYMFMALGCALMAHGKTKIGEDVTHELAVFAVTAAMFHLFTHAFFKALLFLSAGSVMTAMHHVIDMRKFSGLRHVLPYTHWTFLAGALSLSAVPLTSGFFSKDEILEAVWQASREAGGSRGTVYLVLLAAGVLTAGLTSFYTFRAYFKTFWGELKLPPETHGHAYESPASMTIPLMILAVPALIVGGILGPLTHRFAKLLAQVPYFPSPGVEHPNWVLMGVSTAFGLSGLALAYVMYVRQPALPGLLARRVPALYQASLNKFFIDEIYLLLFIRPAEALAALIRKLDFDIVDQFVDLVGQVPRLIGGLFRPVQNGLVQFYALAMILGLTVFLLALVRSL